MLALLIARVRAVRPLSRRVGVSATLVSLLIMLAQPDAQAVIAWLLSIVGVTRFAHLVPLLTRLLGGITVLAALFAHPATSKGAESAPSSTPPPPTP